LLEAIPFHERTPAVTAEITRLNEQLRSVQDENTELRRPLNNLLPVLASTSQTEIQPSASSSDSFTIDFAFPERRRRQVQEVALPEGTIDRWNQLVVVSFLPIFLFCSLESNVSLLEWAATIG